MAKKIYMASFKGGTGVTTCCVGLGRALARAGERTLIVDGDTKSGSATIIGGVRDLTVYTLDDYEKGACRAKQTLISDPKDGNLYYTSSVGLKDLSAATRAVADVDGLFDFILLDKTAFECCDGALIVTEPFAPSVRSADCCRSALVDDGIRDLGLIVNKICGGQIIDGCVMTAHEISAVLHLPLRAVIPEDLTLSAGKWRQPTLNAFKMAAENICGKRDGAFNALSGYGGLNGLIKRRLREKI